MITHSDSDGDRDYQEELQADAKTEHPSPSEHGTSTLVRKEGLGGAVGTAVGTTTGAAAGAAVGGFAGPAGMAIGALVGAAAGAIAGKAAGDPLTPELEKEAAPQHQDDADGPKVGD
ncbi:hypothetical protein [Haloferula sp. BvORR071]|uniref:hypothetical protein n=1 Tax=Haloferula sp. BvORR071 TaxID=1396141 RepID=UPI00055004EC|nr:hypothetical protein [Haloferula sp. BvORR071]